MLLTITKTYLKKCLECIQQSINYLIPDFDLYIDDQVYNTFLSIRDNVSTCAYILRPALSLGSGIVRLINIPNAIKAEESVTNLAITLSDEVKVKKDKCIEFDFLLIKIISDFLL